MVVEMQAIFPVHCPPVFLSPFGEHESQTINSRVTCDNVIIETEFYHRLRCHVAHESARPCFSRGTVRTLLVFCLLSSSNSVEVVLCTETGIV